jgi:short-subunit dehydrogenase/predicted outer membrane protein
MKRSLLLLALVCLLPLAGCRSLSDADRRQLAGKTFVITGASSGFGRGVATELASHGANVVLAARRTELLEEVAAEARAAGGAALVVPTDVGMPDEVQRLADEALARFGRIDVWINGVGVGAIGRFWDVPIADYSRMVDVNLKSVIYGSHAALRQFRTQGYGTLVNIGSVDSEVPLAYQTGYSATKAGVLSLGRALNEELRLAGLRNIRVATVMPWAADTPFWQHSANYSGGTPRMVAMDPPQKIVDALVWISLHPREEMAVGWKAKGSYVSHKILPDLTERISANIAHRWQIETAPPAPPTTGALHAAIPEGRGVEGGNRERMEREDEARARGEVVAYAAMTSGGGETLAASDIAGIVTVANRGEVQQAEAAMPRLTSSSARDFATMMIRHHTAALEEGTAVFKANGIMSRDTNRAAVRLREESDRIVASLQADTGSADLTYIRSQIDVHQGLLAMMDAQLVPAARGEVLQLLEKQRATVASHLDRARRIAEELSR